MVRTGETSHTCMVSPFLLPYILADREELRKLARTAIEGSPTEPLMLSPMEEHPIAAHSYSPRSERFQSVTRHAPLKRNCLEAMSPEATHQSVIEASISELRFDPDLTFMDSPPQTASPSPKKRRVGHDLSSVSLPADASPMQHVSPDRVVVPVDESEIGFSNELRASLDIDKQSLAKMKKVSKPVVRIVEVQDHKPLKLPPKSGLHAMDDSTPRLPNRRTKEPKTEDVSPRLARSTRRPAPPASEGTVSDATPRVTRSSRRGGARPMEPVEEESTVHRAGAESSAGRPKRKVEEMPFKPVVRKSPRFASTVLGAADFACPKCSRSFKRKDVRDKHTSAAH